MVKTPRYVFKYLRQKFPQAVRRRIEARRSALRLASQKRSKSSQIFVAILVTGVVGDSVIAARYLRDLTMTHPELAIDVFSADVGQSRWIFESVGGIRDHFQDSLFDTVADEYDISLVFSDTVAFRHARRGNADLPEPIMNFIAKLASYSKIESEAPESRHHRESTLSLELFFKHSQTRASASHFISGIRYEGPQFPLSVDDDAIERYGLTKRSYITVHNGFSVAEVAVNKTSTKSYMRFSEVIQTFRGLRPDFKFVQIGAATSVPIENVDLNLLGNTTLRQAASLVKNSICHLDNESGLVSIASCFGTRCCVVYGPTHPEYFYYKGNVAVRAVECGCCWWLSKDWMTRCPRGMTQPACMHSQPPSAVAKSLRALLDSIEN